MNYSWKGSDPFDDPVISPPGPSSFGPTCEGSGKMNQDLCDQSFSPELEYSVDTEMFFSDDEEEGGEEYVGYVEPPRASGSNGNCEETRQNRLQWELDSMITRVEDLQQENNTLKNEKMQLWLEKREREGELFKEKESNAVLKQKLEALEGQHQREKELTEKAKVCNKVLREGMESVQEQFKQKVIKEKISEKTICEGKEIQARMKIEIEQLEAEVCRLTEALAASSKEDRGGVHNKKMLRGTHSAPGGLAGHTPLPKGEESSRCHFAHICCCTQGRELTTIIARGETD